VGVIVQRDDECTAVVKKNDDSGWSSDGVMLWLGKMQNGDTVEWWREWQRLRWSFYSNGGLESDGPGRMSCSGGANSIL
jgi:hypothetical protein